MSEGTLFGAAMVLQILFMLVMFAIAAAAFAMIVVALIDALKYTDEQYFYARQNKIAWVLIILLIGGIGALIYWLVARPALRDVAARPLPPRLQAPPVWGYQGAPMPPAQPWQQHPQAGPFPAPGQQPPPQQQPPQQGWLPPQPPRSEPPQQPGPTA